MRLSIKNLTDEDIKNTVNQIILSKVEEGQLDNTGLNEKELKKIRESLTDTLGVIYHRRTIK